MTRRREADRYNPRWRALYVSPKKSRFAPEPKTDAETKATEDQTSDAERGKR